MSASDSSGPPYPPAGREWWVTLVRWAVGGVLLYSGAVKAFQPADFLKLLREYDLTTLPFLLNSIAAGLPWFEVFLGLLLLAGVAVRGTALLTLMMLVPFTFVVWKRALALQASAGIAFCAVRFDCGCGTGEMAICRKLAENCALIIASVFLVRSRHSYASVRHCLLPGLEARRSP